MHKSALTTPMMSPGLQWSKYCGCFQNVQIQQMRSRHLLVGAADAKHVCQVPEGCIHSADWVNASGSRYRPDEKEDSTRTAKQDWPNVSDLTSSYVVPQLVVTGIF